MKQLTLFILAFMLCISCEELQETKATSYVNPFIGTEGGGNTFMGASLPFGMVKAGPDCADMQSNSGYVPGAEINGFSHTHVSGTGGGPKYGNILFMPFSGDFLPDNCAAKPANYKATPGYLAVDLLEKDIHVELSVSHSAAYHKYSYLKPGKKGFLIDVSSFLGAASCCNEAQELVHSEINIIAEDRIEGSSTVKGGWNKGEEYTVFFSAIMNTPASEYGVWMNDELLPSVMISKGADIKNGAYFIFDDDEHASLEIKVGISFISTQKAFENIQKEMDHWDFEKVSQNAENEWDSMLSRISVETENEDLKTILYSALYHSLLMPSDRSGENPKWETSAPYYDDFYAIWDTYRATHPLFLLLCPEKQTDIINALLDIYIHEGYMPDARSGNSSGRTQGGSNCDVLIADAFSKGLKGIDYEKGLEAMLKNAQKDPGMEHQKWGRGGLLDYNKLGYVSTDHERAGTRTVEYAYNDYCIAVVADGLGKQELANKFRKRSENWNHLWKPVEDSGAKGFIMPKNKKGSWDEDYRGRAWSPEKGWSPADFTVHAGGTWQDFFYEASSWEYSFYVPQDVKGLIDSCGGKQAFNDRLDTFFNKGYYNVGNEPSFLTPVLYNYIGRQDKTSDRVREILAKRFKASASGIPGNDDSGSMSAWAAFHLMGFYPNAGQDLYLISSPHFDKVTIQLENEEEFKILTHGLSEENVYITKVLLNGKELQRSWFRHTEIKDGGTLEFFMGDKPDNAWEKEEAFH